MFAGRPHEVVGNGSPRWMITVSASAEFTGSGLQIDSSPLLGPRPDARGPASQPVSLRLSFRAPMKPLGVPLSVVSFFLPATTFARAAIAFLGFDLFETEMP